MRRRTWHVLGLWVCCWLFGQTAHAQSNNSAALQFLHVYNSDKPLAQFLAFETTPRANIPDGQIHWVDAEVPGIDIHSDVGTIYNVCPEGGNAWSVAAGDLVGGGGQFVAVDCLGLAQGWQMLAFHLCDVQIAYSPSPQDRQYVPVKPGQAIGKECSHTHLSLGYWAAPDQRKNLPCPQWYVQERYWVNAICLTVTGAVDPNRLPSYAFKVSLDDDWELRWLQTDQLRRFKDAVFAMMLFGLVFLSLNYIWQQQAIKNGNLRPAQADWAPPWMYVFASVAAVLVLFVFSNLAVWELGSRWQWATQAQWATADERAFRQVADAVGYHNWRLLQAFYQVAVPRRANGQPSASGEVGKIFPPAAAAVIPFGETNTADWGIIDPTVPGAHGQYKAWDAVVARWPATFYERVVLGLQISATAQAQRAGLQAIAASPSMVALGAKLGKVIRAEDLYGSTAGAVGRTQVLPSYFAPDGLCGSAPSKDVWNDPLAIAECTTRHMVVNGCWGSWWATGDVWSAICGYNPGAWGVAEHQWYWDVLGDRMNRLTAASVQLQQLPAISTNTTPTQTPSLPPVPTETVATTAVAETAVVTVPTGAGVPAVPTTRPATASGTLVPTPILLMLFAQVVTERGEHAQSLPQPLDWFAKAIAPPEVQTNTWHYYRFWYRFWRAWVLIYYSPAQLAKFGAQF